MSFKIFGVRVQITFYFCAMLCFMLLFRVPTQVLLTVLSSFLHEIGHITAIKCFGGEILNLSLEMTGINIIRRQSVKTSLLKEALIALAGPFVNLCIFLFSIILYCLFKKEALLILGCVNLLLCVFNLLPIKGLDGGAALYFLALNRKNADFSSSLLKNCSVASLILVYCWGIYVFLAGGFNFSVLIIAVFLTASIFQGNEY